MAIKSFTTGDVLTAADTNTYLANAGLVYVTQASFGGATALNIDSCFTSTYTHYLLEINVVPNAAVTFSYLLRAAGVSNGANNTVSTGYYQTTGAAAMTGDFRAATTFGNLGFAEATYGGAINLWIWNPQVAKPTFAHCDSIANNFVSHYDMVHQTSTQYDGIRITTVTGTPTMTGDVRIYGARIS